MVRAVAGIRHILWLDLLLTAFLLALMVAAVTFDSLWYHFSPRLKIIISLFANFALIIATALGLYATDPAPFPSSSYLWRR